MLLEGGEGEIVEKKSRFIATIRKCETEEEAVAFIEEMKKKYWDARHNCSAFVIGSRGELTRCSDDGEPSGTAGRPMLEVLLGEGIRNIAVVVTRYFGGTLLGTGGLVRAYTAAAKAALEDAGISQMAKWTSVRIPCPYNAFERIKRLLDEQSAVIENTDYGVDVVISALVREDHVETFAAALRELSAGSIAAEIIGECFCGVPLT